MDIVWSIKLYIVRNVSGETVDNTVVYSDAYNNNGSLLNEGDNGKINICHVQINYFTIATGYYTIDVTIVSITLYNCNYVLANLYIVSPLISLPNVTVTALSDEQVGQPLLLTCNVRYH